MLPYISSKGEKADWDEGNRIWAREQMGKGK